MARIVQGLGRNWAWPDADHECIKVIFDWMSDLTRTERFCKQKRTAIQAGGNMGVWPWVLSKSFGRVLTFEPDAECFGLLTANLRGVANVDAAMCALSDRDERCGLVIEPRNRGAQYIVPAKDGAISCVRIDDLGCTDCDLIYLDIEGAELKALRGAVETIARSRPVIALEDKGLSVRFRTSKYDAEKWLENFGYKVVGRYHNDVVLICE